MANLTDIVSTLLEQIANGQVAADARSAGIQAAYEGNPAMSRFEAPRPVIQAVSLELKVAFRSAPALEVALTADQRDELLQRIAAEARGVPDRPAVAPHFTRKPDLRARWERAAREVDAGIAAMIPAEKSIDASRVSSEAAARMVDALSSTWASSSGAGAVDEALRELAPLVASDIERALRGVDPSAGVIPPTAQRKLSRVIWDIPFQRPVAELFAAQEGLVEAWDAAADELLARVQVELSGAPEAGAARAADIIVQAARAELSPEPAAAPEGLSPDERQSLRDELSRAVLEALRAVAGPALKVRNGDLDVIIATDELASIPPERVSTLRLDILQPAGTGARTQ